MLLVFVLAAAQTAAATEPTGGPEVLPAGAARPVVGERLGFHGNWLGIPVGYGWMEVKEIVPVNGRDAYHIEVHGRTNDVLSQLYPIHDEIHSYLDVETLRPVRFEKDQREGRYRAKEIVEFDYGRSIATYRSLINGSVKEIPLPETFHDLISAIYWFRSQPLTPGNPLTMDLYTDEKFYRTEMQVSQPLSLELLKRGTFRCVIVEPKATFKGFLVKRGRLWAYLTTDTNRLPLLVKATTPWGQMSAVLDADSIPETLRRPLTKKP